ncbi:hypothetical protein scyTo_0003687 [Scyliorhinus torazame]|uniref:RRM domain-containing protein n=1 Tax=Scyliorhinus torazame TaxID=75743 RepID=A0A401PN96_SCYTO|nr:hypothetical protein [Scyliorhinus torazame]
MKMTKEESEEESEGEVEVEVAVPTKAGTRKKGEQKAATAAQKHEAENGASFSFFVGKLNPEKNLEELKKALNGFFTKKKLSATRV